GDDLDLIGRSLAVLVPTPEIGDAEGVPGFLLDRAVERADDAPRAVGHVGVGRMAAAGAAGAASGAAAAHAAHAARLRAAAAARAAAADACTARAGCLVGAVG